VPRFDAKQNHQGLQLVMQGSLEPSETPAAETPLLAAMVEAVKVEPMFDAEQERRRLGAVATAS